MSAIAIRAEHSAAGLPQFRAVAGQRQSVGRTMGEALDALTAAWGTTFRRRQSSSNGSQPDVYFTAAQCTRMQELLARRATLTAAERAELETLIDAELEATIVRTESLLRPPQP